MRLLTIEELRVVCGAGEEAAPAVLGGVTDSGVFSDPDDTVRLYNGAVAAATDLIEWVANKF